jgi:uncharacterized protein GlcG (DUF336 family)
MRGKRFIALVSSAALTLSGCGGGGTPASNAVTPPPPAATTVYSVPAAEALSILDVQQIIAQAVAEARARSAPAVIAVTDRVGNVLAVYSMVGALQRLAVPDAPGGESQNNDLQGFDLITGAPLGAISKAVTGAYLSSGGNAFSSRTASQIVQEHFPPAPSARGLESGPLSGVQFSQLPCSDLSQRFGTSLIGPKRAPLGLSADAGGLPLYKNGVLVGGIGVMGDGQYGFDPNTLNIDQENDEFTALAGTTGFEAPVEIQANRITVDGTSLRFSDARRSGLMATSVPAFTTFTSATGAIVDIRGYSAARIIAGTAYGSEESGVRAATPAEFNNRDAFILTDGSGNARYPIRGGTDAAQVTQPLTAAESRAILEEAFTIMSRARGQIRRPLDSRAQVSISLVDSTGAILGIVRAPDAPIFGVDVSLQKARTSAFLSNASAQSMLIATPSPDVLNMVLAAQTFFNDPSVFTGKTAFGDRTVGNIHRPYFPDGEVGRTKGPFSRSIEGFNPFSTGLQSTLISANVLAHALFVLRRNATDTPQRCTQIPDIVAGFNPVQNGIQIFPGSVPIYRGSTLIGAIGVSGDGIDQDDMISFLGVSNAGAKLGGFGNADPAMRSDQIVIGLADGASVRLRYVSCPFAPFLDTSEQNVCQGR